MLRQIDKDKKQDMIKAFHLIDADKTGKVTFKNLKKIATELGETLTDDEIHEMISEADKDRDGEVNQAEFIEMMQKIGLC